MFRTIIVALCLLAACSGLQVPPSPREIASKRFERVPGKAVIYMVRDIPDFAEQGASVMLDDALMGTTYPGTYLLWIVDPGAHRLAGFAGDAGSLALTVEADSIYFVQQSVSPTFFGPAQSYFRPVAEPYGRAAVMRSQLLGG